MTTGAGNLAAQMTEKSRGKVVDSKVVESKVAESKAVEKPGVGKKVMEKRRALGRGLESLIPSPQPSRIATSDTELGPRVVMPAVGSPGVGSAGQETAAVSPLSEAGAVLDQAQQADAPNPSSALHVEAVVSPISELVDLQAQEESPLKPTPGLSGARGTNWEPSVTTSVGENRAPMSSSSGDEVVKLALDLIDQNPHQTRRFFGEETLRELGESIRVQGVLQPIVVRVHGEGRYKLILGERRVRASRLAGLETIPAIVKRVSEQQAAEMTLVENLQRQDLNCVEQAEAFSNLSKEFQLTQEQIGARVGLSRETVSNYMRVLSLPEGVLGALISGKLTFSHAKVMLQMKTKDPVSLWYYAKKAIDHGMSVKRFEDFVLGKFNPPEDRPPGDTKHAMGGGARWVDPNVKAAQRSLEEVLGMRVRIRDRQGRGKILIEYSTIDDFQRVVEMLGGRK